MGAVCLAIWLCVVISTLEPERREGAFSQPWLLCLPAAGLVTWG